LGIGKNFSSDGAERAYNLVTGECQGGDESSENPDFGKPSEGVKSLPLITTVIWPDAKKRYKIHESVIQ
jgi:hypothetical protein